MTAPRLARTLRELREKHYGRKIPQKVLATALGVSPPSISAWEGGVVPPADRLRAYAVLFASPRWLESGCTPNLDPEKLDGVERETFRTLIEELDAQARLAGTPATTPAELPADFWHFSDGGHIRILCGGLDPNPAVPYADATDHNFILLRTVADADALLELWGHVRACNPESDVRYRIGEDRISAGDRRAHLIILGNIAQMQGAGKLLPPGALPVEQVRAEGVEGEVFRLLAEPRTTFGPTITDGVVTEDVGLIARVPNPNNKDRSITVCSGVFTRGVYGAAQCLTNRDLRETNTEALRTRFGALKNFALLMRVRVTGGDTDAPDLRITDNWLHPHATEGPHP